jgi:hypothetical protein
MIEWDSELYLRYEQERTQPSIDLVQRIPLEAPQEIIDLGSIFISQLSARFEASGCRVVFRNGFDEPPPAVADPGTAPGRSGSDGQTHRLQASTHRRP